MYIHRGIGVFGGGLSSQTQTIIQTNCVPTLVSDEIYEISSLPTLCHRPLKLPTNPGVAVVFQRYSQGLS